MVAKLVLIIPSFVVYWKGVMHVFNSQVCDQVEQILMEFGKAPEQGYMLNQLRSHRFHHTIINGFFFLSFFFLFFFFLFFYCLTIPPLTYFTKETFSPRRLWLVSCHGLKSSTCEARAIHIYLTKVLKIN